MASLIRPPRPTPPPPERPPVPMPDPAAPEVVDAGRDAAMRRRRASGRASTLLSSGSGDTGGTYSRTMLGT